jgi:glycosyltransferase involved in cell wall biosynthesis
MRILIVGSDPRQGLLYYPVRLACAMKAFGHEVRVATWGDRAQTPGLRNEATEGCLQLLAIPSLAHAGVRALLSPSVDLRRVVWTWRPDVVQTFGPVSNAQAFVVGARALRVVSVEAMGHGSKSPWPARAGAMLLRPLAHAVVALCKEEVGRLRRAWVPAKKLRVIYNPIDCDDLVGRAARAEAERGALLTALRAPPSAKLVGHFANFQLRKRHSLVLRAFADISSSHPHAYLVLAGEGEALAMCKQLAAALRIADRVVFPGRLPTDRSVALLASMDVVVHASVAETFGYSIVEPLLFGRRTIVARAGIATEVEEAGAAIVVDPDDQRAVARHLHEVLSGTSAFKPRVDTAGWVRENFDVPVIARRYLDLYGELYRKVKPRPAPS